MDFEPGAMVDLDAYEPIFEGEDDGLVIKGYEIDGEFLLDFDWEPGSKWAFLEDDAQFREFTVGMIERMTGRAMTSVELEDLEFFRGSQGAGPREADEVDAACAAD